MTATNKQSENDLATAEANPWLAAVKEEVSGLRFGTVQVIVHEGEVVQIERISRRRIGAAATLSRHLSTRSVKQTSTGN